MEEVPEAYILMTCQTSVMIRIALRLWPRWDIIASASISYAETRIFDICQFRQTTEFSNVVIVMFLSLLALAFNLVRLWNCFPFRKWFVTCRSPSIGELLSCEDCDMQYLSRNFGKALKESSSCCVLSVSLFSPFAFCLPENSNSSTIPGLLTVAWCPVLAISRTFLTGGAWLTYWLTAVGHKEEERCLWGSTGVRLAEGRFQTILKWTGLLVNQFFPSWAYEQLHEQELGLWVLSQQWCFHLICGMIIKKTGLLNIKQKLYSFLT